MSVQKQQNIFLLIFNLVFYALALPVDYGGISIDSSWHEALVMAINKHEVFGRDFIFNYGPLGYFNTRVLPQGVSAWLMVLIDTFMLLNFLIINKLALMKAKESWKVVAIISLLMLMPWGFIADCSFTFFYFFLFWLFYSQRQKNAVTLLLAALISVLIFYVKVNLSIIVYGVFYLSLLYFWGAKIISIRSAIITAILQISLTYSLSFLLNVDIPAYLQASLKIIDAYQDAMAEMILSKQEFLSLFAFEVLIIGIVLVYIFQNFKQFLKYQNLYFFTLIALATFLCFKQAHTAVGHYNVFGFFLFLSALMALIYIFGDLELPNTQPKFFSIGKVCLSVFMISVLATQLLRFYMGGSTLKGYLLTYPPAEVAKQLNKEFNINSLAQIFAIKNPIIYFQKVISYDYENNFKDAEKQKKMQLPANILAKIGKQSVDIMPTDISYILFNQLNYNHRPIIQTYQANNDWLAEKNGEKYLSKIAPEFVLFQVKSFREQNHFWADVNASLALLKNYTLIDTAYYKNIENQADTLFLFKKNEVVKSLNTSNLTKKIFQLNEKISIDSTQKLLYFDANIQYSFWGKLARLFFQPPYLYCNVTYENGTVRTFRVINTILKGGILVNKRVTTQAEAAQFFLSAGKANLKAKNITFWAKYKWGFKQEFEGSFKEIIF